ncbi:hypothetical protein ['Camptotheca acuminata' phytoplasma]|uniref:hypothetical protein n=1 Tax='Camptotheca acuminata' phytoplasma TaxID=3239192 RepID=UPI00351A89CE
MSFSGFTGFISDVSAGANVLSSSGIIEFVFSSIVDCVFCWSGFVFFNKESSSGCIVNVTFNCPEYPSTVTSTPVFVLDSSMI